MELYLDLDQWRYIVNEVTLLRIPIIAGNLIISWKMLLLPGAELPS